MRGIVTDIMRFSLKDGPGIRTTVFLKGCNMVCKWCHNPETLSINPQILNYPERCIGCFNCARACKHGSIVIEGYGAASRLAFYTEKCIDCGACADVCYTGARVMSGKEMTVDEVMAEVSQDVNYYRNSGGGVTVSGGEATVQPEFTLAILESCKKSGISTAIETNMLADWRVFEQLIPALDLVMLDVKLFDSDAHRKWTGVGNGRILENVKKMSACLPIIVRTPVIPDVNDTAGEIGKIASFVKGLDNVEYYELLLYNPLGESKYQALGMKNRFSGRKPQTGEEKRLLTEAAQACGKAVRVM
ncbi:MAG: glycyl-radical enzyme activating protein [Clostridiales bacterium]|jgi:pyruvate formate lyase activating enzyme|nr:glycyl-radical enzyme activating protein [Clostridiales bacterium]